MKVDEYGGKYRQVGFRCPGCKRDHIIPVEGPNAWGFNGSCEQPTFTPSILVNGFEMPTPDEHRRLMAGEEVPRRPFVCHSYVTNGQIQFLSDSTHKLSGQTVELDQILIHPE